ncbi:hybrid sensor histidine kinase/response regulator transcription factor [Dyadobacter sp. OTU695]|uniref:hybrid sensor histidine kinase/response regulator transcription factor n=1 Tax=Dyadobacter sp. OTU695 TaxID=3043860 RepID=UPI00313E5E58
MKTLFVFRRAVLVILIICSTRFVQAQAFRNLTGMEGASMSDTRGIVQDKQGFIWFATNAGLFRYDSRTLKKYPHNSSDPHSISSDMLNAVFCDSKGNLWIGGTGGLDFYNRETDNFTHIDHNLPNTNPELNNNIYFIFEDRDHRILVGTPFGLNAIVITKGGTKITYILHRPGGLDKDIFSVSQTSEGDLWAGSDNGIVHLPANGAPQRFFYFSSANKSPLINDFRTQYLDKRNVIWLGPSAGGIVQFDIGTNTFIPMTGFVDPEGGTPVVTQILPDGKGKLWMATHSGLALFDPASRKSTWYRNQPGNIYSLADNLIQTMCLDRQGGIWLGTYYFGVSNFYPNSPRFLPWPFVVNGISDVRYANSWMGNCRDGKLWVIGKDQKKLFLFDASGIQARSFDLKLRPSSDYYHFYIDTENMLWAAGNTVLTSFNLESGVYHHYPTVAVGSDKLLDDGRVYDILEDSSGRFWLIGTFGALLFDKHTGRFRKYRSVTYAHSMLEDSKQNLWVGGGDEVFVLKHGATDFEEVATDKSRVRGNFARVWQMAEDGAGRIWAVTRQGLQSFDSSSGKFRLDPKIALLKIEDFQIDNEGYFWLATEAELTRYHPDKHTLQTYGYQDGLPFNGISRPASSVKSVTGMLYFTTNKGIFQFSPSQVTARGGTSRLVLTQLKLLDREVRAGDDTGLLARNLDQTQELTLRHDQNIFTISFSLLSFPRSERNQYAYKLEGFDNTWTYTGSQSANYMNLPPGGYVFTVRAANGDGYWNPDPLRLKINILPPRWKTWYAYLAYILLTAATVYAVTRFFWLRSSFRKENALNRVKLDFFTNVSHEIRTHLSLISAPMQKAFQHAHEGRTVEHYLGYAKNNSDRLLLLVNELLDFRKIQSGGVRLQVQEHDVVKIMKSVIAAFEHTAKEKDIETTLACPDTPVLLWLDIAQMQKVFYNLLSNAYKFAPEGGKVVVRIVEASKEVSITVHDNGNGIRAEHLRKLFTYYYQADSEKPGYGIGLALSKSIVEQHHGYLTAESRPETETMAGSTTLTIRMLRENRHFSPEQITPKNSDYIGSTLLETVATLPKAHNGVSAKKGNTILIIEDNDQLRVFIRELFESEFNTLEAENGLRGLHLANEHLPDIVLSDIMMPDMNGLQVCSHLKENITTSHIPVVLLTARAQNQQIIEGLASGADDYLVKPFDPRILELKVRNLIRLRDDLKERYRQSVVADQLESRNIAQDKNQEFITKLSSLVKENISDRDFGVNELATQIGMSVSSLYRKLRSLTGLTINDFMKTVRFNEAKKLLDSGVYNVSEVSTMIGFDDSKYFSTEFKKIFGKTPTETKRGKVS